MYGKLADTIKGGGITGKFAAKMEEKHIKDDVPNAMLRERVLDELAAKRRRQPDSSPGATRCAVG